MLLVENNLEVQLGRIVLNQELSGIDLLIYWVSKHKMRLAIVHAHVHCLANRQRNNLQSLDATGLLFQRRTETL